MFANIFFHPICCLFFCLWLPMLYKSFYVWLGSIWLFLLLFLLPWERLLLWFMSENVLLMFSSKNFMISSLIFNSLNHFKLIFVYDVRKCSNFIDYVLLFSFPNTFAWETSFFLYIFLPPLPKINWPQVYVFASRLSILCHWSICLLLCPYHSILMIVAL